MASAQHSDCTIRKSRKDDQQLDKDDDSSGLFVVLYSRGMRGSSTRSFEEFCHCEQFVERTRMIDVFGDFEFDELPTTTFRMKKREKKRRGSTKKGDAQRSSKEASLRAKQP